LVIVNLESITYYSSMGFVRKMPHITHKGGSQEVSHVQSLISRLAGREEKRVQQLLSVGLALSSIWEKTRARDRQREEVGVMGHWGFVLQGMRAAAKARSRYGQKKVVGDKEQFAWFCKG
jgi:hypothetical protein